MQEKYFKLDAREENGLIYIATNDEKIKGYIRQIPGARLVENANTYWTIPVSRTNFLCVESAGVPTQAFKNYRELRAKVMKPEQFLIDAFEQLIPPYQPNKKLLPHQIDVCSLALTTRGMINSSERGCGKTATGWAIIHAVKSKKTLIVVNKPGMREWKNQQFDIFAPKKQPERNHFVYLLDENEEVAVKANKLRFFKDKENLLPVIVINYEILEKLAEAIIEYNPDVIIFDESWKIKNPKAKTTDAAIRVSDYAKKVMLMNGSPIGNHVGDYWSQVLIAATKEYVTESYDQWLAKYAKTVSTGSPFGIQIKYTGCKNPVGLMERISPFCYRATKQTCLTLPPKKRYRVILKMEEKQREVYASVMFNGTAALEEFGPSNAAVIQLRLRQIASGFCYDPESKNKIKHLPSAKLDWIYDFIKDRNEEDPSFRCIIWCYFNAEVERIVYALKKAGIKCEGITGSGFYNKNNDQIDDIKKRFNDREHENGIQVLVCQIKKMAFAHNLQAADVHIVHGQTFSKIDREQMEDRSHRMGRTEAVEYYELVCTGTVDEDVYNALNKKDSVANRVSVSTVSTKIMDIDSKDTLSIVNSENTVLQTLNMIETLENL